MDYKEFGIKVESLVNRKLNTNQSDLDILYARIEELIDSALGKRIDEQNEEDYLDKMKRICDRYQSCFICPLREAMSCGGHTHPTSWDIPKLKECIDNEWGKINMDKKPVKEYKEACAIMENNFLGLGDLPAQKIDLGAISDDDKFHTKRIDAETELDKQESKSGLNERISEEIPRNQRLEELEILVTNMRKVLHCNGLTTDESKKDDLSNLFLDMVVIIKKHLASLQNELKSGLNDEI